MKTTHTQPSHFANVLPFGLLKTKPLAASLALLLASLLAGGSAQAVPADLNWQGVGNTSQTTDFNLGTNWQNSTLPDTDDIAFFNNTSGVLNSNVSGNITIGGIAIGNGNHTISSSSGFAITLTSNSSATSPRPAFYGFAAAQTEIVSADLILAPTSTTNSYFFGNAATSNFLFSGNISGSSMITLAGGGNFTFSGNNTFNGGITIASSPNNLSIGSENALGTGPLQLSTGAGSNNQTVSNTSGGELTLSNGLTFARGQTSQNANFTGSNTTFNGTVKLLNANNANTTLIVSNKLTLNGNVNNTGFANGGIVKEGVGTLVLSGANTYNGTTTVSAGTMLVNNTAGSGLGTGNVTVNGGGTLGGNGTFTGAVTVNSGGTLAPGASIESLGSGALTLNDNSTFAYEVDSGVATGVGADLQVASGNLTLTGTATLTLANIDLTPITFADNTTFTLINYNGTWNNGLFTYNSTVLNDDSQFSFNGQTWQINYNAATGGLNFPGNYLGGADSFVNITVIPEPATFALLAFGMTTVMLLRRRRA